MKHPKMNNVPSCFCDRCGKQFSLEELTETTLGSICEVCLDRIKEGDMRLKKS